MFLISIVEVHEIHHFICDESVLTPNIDAVVVVFLSLHCQTLKLSCAILLDLLPREPVSPSEAALTEHRHLEKALPSVSLLTVGDGVHLVRLTSEGNRQLILGV